ncbi:MAG: hypothetical protein OEM02_07465, partial [Desulfobulbaceae bacterium]|nr:hypothetical protein [Desulfobulbaceae bacterium]
MAKKKKKKAAKNKKLDPLEVLAGKVKPTSKELIRLIHQVNPSGERLGTKVEAERYRLKSELQSLLINRGESSLIIEQPDPEDPDLIGIKLKHFDEDACHALLSELEPEARSKAQFWIDSEISGQGGRHKNNINTQQFDSGLSSLDQSSDKDDYSSGELVAQGKRALEQYDYEECEKCFTSGFKKSLAGRVATLELFKFLIDNIAAYDKVISLSKSLPKATVEDQDVKILIATAEARKGNIDKALGIVARSNHLRASEIFLLAANHYLRQGNTHRASELHGALLSRNPPELMAEIDLLGGEIKERIKASLLPYEEEMLGYREKGDLQRAVDVAHRILEEIPEHRSAGKIVGEFKRVEKDKKQNILLQRADKAKEEGQLEEEVKVVQKALELTPEDVTLIERLKSVKEALKDQLRQNEVQNTIAHYNNGERQTAYHCFIALDEEQRASLTKQVQQRDFLRLSRISQAHPNLKPDKMIEPLIALERAEQALAKNCDLDEIRDYLATHDQVLKCLDDACEIRHRVEESYRCRQLKVIEQYLLSAEKYIDNSDVSALSDCLKRIDEKLLTTDQIPRFRRLASELIRLERIVLTESTYTQGENHGDLFIQRDAAEQLAKLEIGKKAADWRQQQVSHVDMLRQQWSLRILDIDSLPTCYGNAISHRSTEEALATLVFKGREYIVRPYYFSKNLFLFMFCIDRQKFVKAVHLVTPDDYFVSEPDITFHQHKIYIFGNETRALAIGLDPLEIIMDYQFGGEKKEGVLVEQSLVCPEKGYYWIYMRNKDGEELYDIYNLESRRLERSFKIDDFPKVIRKEGGNEIALVLREQGEIRIYSEQGKLLKTIGESIESIVSGVKVHPDQQRYIILVYNTELYADTQSEEYDDLVRLRLKVLDGKTIVSETPVVGSNGEMVNSFGVSSDNSMIYVVYANLACLPGYPTGLTAFSIDGDAVALAYTVQLRGDHYAIYDDQSGGAAVLAFFCENDAFAIKLGKSEPVISLNNYGINYYDHFIRPISNSDYCNFPTGKLFDSIQTHRENISEETPGQVFDRIEDIKQDPNQDPDDIYALIDALGTSPHVSFEGYFRQWFLEKYPQHFSHKMDQATEACKNRDWSRVISLLEPLTHLELDDGTACHVRHLLGIGYMGEGDTEHAISTLQEGLTLTGGSCPFEELLDYVKFEGGDTDKGGDD